jgi:hypothetical protein
MPEVLRTVYGYVIQDPRGTSLSGAFQRGPIMHGRQLAYGTEVNSTKAFALLSGVIDWLKPKGRPLNREVADCGRGEVGRIVNPVLRQRTGMYPEARTADRDILANVCSLQRVSFRLATWHGAPRVGGGSRSGGRGEVAERTISGP